MRTNTRSIGRSRPITLVVVLLATLVLAACGVDDEDDPPPAPTVAPPVATSPAPSAASPVSDGATPAASGAVPAGGTPAAMTNTVGNLAQGIAAAWPQTSYRRVQSSGPAPGSTPAAGLPALTVTDEVAYPASVHRTVVDSSGATSAEFILIDGQLFARGSLIPPAFQTGTAPETWVRFSEDMLTPGSPGGNILAQLEALFLPRYSGLAPEEQARDAVLISEASIEGQPCFVFSTVETTQTGERLDVEIALTPEGRLCTVTTTGGGQETVETFTYDVPLTIAAPDAVATPVAATPGSSPEAASPEASPAATPET